MPKDDVGSRLPAPPGPAVLAAHLGHRVGLTDRCADLFPRAGLLRDLGGAGGVARVVEAFYDRVEADPELRPMFTAEMSEERTKLGFFFIEWLGGAPGYSRRYGRVELRERHRHIHITARAAGRWLAHLKEALAAAGVPPEAGREFLHHVAPLARGHATAREAAPDPRDLRCEVHKPWVVLAEAARKGRLELLEEAFEREPDLYQHPNPDRLRLLVQAARGGRLAVVEFLLARGAPLDAPAPEGGVWMTPWCAARAFRKGAVAGALRARGARHDVFSAAILGDGDRIEELADEDLGILDLEDPATDFARRRPVEYAAARGHWDLVARLLDRGASPGAGARALLRRAADGGHDAIVDRLLETDAALEAPYLGAGEWVLHEEVAARLVARGADAGYAPTHWNSWIWDACTGNHGMKDRPEYVRRILACGGDPNATLRGRSALHFAAKAGFPETCRVLVERGAAVNARDLEGATPLDYVARAGKRTDKGALRALLRALGARAGRELEEAPPAEG